MRGEIDLSRYGGQEITLLFSTDPGPRGDSSFDWAAWSDFHFESDPKQAAVPFQLVYDGEAKVYQYNDVLPRAAIYYEADLETDGAAVLRRLGDPSLHVFRTVVLDRSKLTKSEVEAIEAVNHPTGQVMEAARIKSYRSNRVEIEASLERGGVLVLNDTGYPGWRVFVDKRPAKWFAANYLFRGVVLRTGTHVVRYEYSPASFYWGSATSLLAFGVLLMFRPALRRLSSARRLSRRTEEHRPSRF